MRIPRELELPSDDTIIRKEGDRIIEPAPARSLLMVLSMLEPIDEGFPPIEEPPTS